jgi:hypothetical protein
VDFTNYALSLDQMTQIGLQLSITSPEQEISAKQLLVSIEELWT